MILVRVTAALGALAVALGIANSSAYADYDSCKRSCAGDYRSCAAMQRSKSPDDCAKAANSCLYSCQQTSTGTTPSGSASKDLETCRPIMDSAINSAMRAGKTDSEVMQAGRDARDRCMSGKGY